MPKNLNLIKNLGESIEKISTIEKLAIFCFTLVIIFSIIFKYQFSLPTILYCFSGVCYFSYIKYFRVSREITTLDDCDVKRIRFITNYEFQRITPFQVDILMFASIILFILATISFIFYIIIPK